MKEEQSKYSRIHKALSENLLAVQNITMMSKITYIHVKIHCSIIRHFLELAENLDTES